MHDFVQNCINNGVLFMYSMLRFFCHSLYRYLTPTSTRAPRCTQLYRPTSWRRTYVWTSWRHTARRRCAGNYVAATHQVRAVHQKSLCHKWPIHSQTAGRLPTPMTVRKLTLTLGISTSDVANTQSEIRSLKQRYIFKKVQYFYSHFYKLANMRI